MRAATKPMGTRNSPPPDTDAAAPGAAAGTVEDAAAGAGAAWRHPQVLLALTAMGVGLVLLPLLIWLLGTRFLGPYTRASEGPAAGPLGLYADFYTALAHGVPAFWAAALGPLVLLYVGRMLLRLLRRPD